MEDRKNKLIVSIILALILIIIIIILVIELKNLPKEDVNTIINSDNFIENSIQNNTVEENNLAIENKTIEKIDKNEDTKQNVSIVDPQQEIDKNTIEKSKTDKEKALEIVKKDWGEDNTVYFSYEYTEKGKHVVFVRDYETHEICKYIVDVGNGTFEKNM